jgi:hypothetical protein
VSVSDDALTTYRGHLAGLAATNRESFGTARLDTRSTASLRDHAYLAQRHRAFETTLLVAIPSAQIIHRFRVSMNGMSVLIPENLIEAVRRLSGLSRTTSPGLLCPCHGPDGLYAHLMDRDRR